MSQLIILRQVLQKQQHFHLKNYFQQHQCNRTISQCTTILHQRAKTTSEESGSGGGLQLSKSGAGRTDISTDVRPLGEKIKDNAETASYTAIILAGVSVMAIMLWAIFRELFSSSSPNNIYSDALERAIKDPRVQDSLGVPIKGFGEESRRGRRQRVAHTIFERNGVPHTRMKFYIQGIRNKATVHLESRSAPSGKMEYRYLFVQLDHYPHTTIILEDNRAFDPVAPSSPNTIETPLGGSSLSFASFDGKK